MNPDKLAEIHIDRTRHSRKRGTFWTILIAVAAVTAAAAYFAWPGKSDDRRVVEAFGTGKNSEVPPRAPSPAAAAASDSVFTVTGYIINRERIEISPHFQGVVKWIGVKKGDAVFKGQVVATLEDDEQVARLHQAEGAVAGAKARLEKGRLDYERAKQLRATKVEAQKTEDDARLDVAAAEAALKEALGTLEYAKSQVEWTIIRSPIDGVVLEKLVDPGELVTPLSFGGTRGPSTAFMALADRNDLQVEVDVNESDLPKITEKEKCRISPEAYPDKFYDGFVAEIAPEANRQKGTLQIKVQILNPDRHLTPELSARVDFLRD